jgi:hypothetical protein
LGVVVVVLLLFTVLFGTAGKRGAPDSRGVAGAGDGKKAGKRGEEGEEGEETGENSVKLFELPQIMPPPPCLFLQVRTHEVSFACFPHFSFLFLQVRTHEVSFACFPHFSFLFLQVRTHEVSFACFPHFSFLFLQVLSHELSFACFPHFSFLFLQVLTHVPNVLSFVFSHCPCFVAQAIVPPSESGSLYVFEGWSLNQLDGLGSDFGEGFFYGSFCLRLLFCSRDY